MSRRGDLATTPRDQIAFHDLAPVAGESFYDWFERKYVPEPNSGCWLWLGPLSSSRTEKGRRAQATLADMRSYTGGQIAFRLYRGPIPAGMLVCHSCDNPLCVNPDHLWLGTHADNQADKARKGRSARGTSHPCNKLSEEQVRAIRASGSSHAEAGRRYGVSERTIQHIRIRRIWRHVN